MPDTTQSENHASLSAKLLNTLASVKFAVTVVVLIALACIVGTILPQGTDVEAFLRKNPGAAVRMEWFGKLGLTHVFYSWWFIGLLCVLAATVATCSTRRFVTLRHTTGFAQRRAFGSMITHISILLILTGGVVRGIWGEKGHLEFREGQTRAEFQVEKGKQPLPFALHLADFQIETYADKEQPGEQPISRLLVEWADRKQTEQLQTTVGVEQTFAGEFKIKVLRYVADFTVDMQTREVTSRSAQPNNPALLVEVVGPNYKNTRWLFAKFPDFGAHGTDGAPQSPLRMIYQTAATANANPEVAGPIKSFKSTVNVIEGEQVVQTKQVEVNSPFRYKGYTFYQSGYNPRDLSWTSLQVVRDPGVPVVYAGFAMMIPGLFVVFYLNPWMEQRKVPKCPSAQVPKHSATHALVHLDT
jgi:cytochrome c biogenesis protein ResB